MVTLIHDLVVDVSQGNYTLMLDRHKLDKKGNPVYETLGYYCTLAGAVKGARDYCVKKRLSEMDFNLPKAIHEMNLVDSEFSDLLRKAIRGADNG